MFFILLAHVRLFYVKSKQHKILFMFWVRESVGRPNLEVDQPELLKTIVDIAMKGSSYIDRSKPGAKYFIAGRLWFYDISNILQAATSNE